MVIVGGSSSPGERDETVGHWVALLGGLSSPWSREIETEKGSSAEEEEEEKHAEVW